MRKVIFDPKHVRGNLSHKDFLDSYYKDSRLVKKLREGTFFISIAGPKGSGKSSLANGLYASLQREGYRVLVTRASEDSDEEFSNHRRALLRTQKSSNRKWQDIVDALRKEAVSALERRVVPFIEENDRLGNGKPGVVILNRYPPVDTLTRQYLLGINTQGVAQRLSGLTDPHTKERDASGYINVNQIYILTCSGKEAVDRMILRETGRQAIEARGFGPDTASRIDRQIKAYHVIAGYDKRTKDIINAKSSFSCKTYVWDTSSTGTIDYQDKTVATMQLSQLESALKNEILNEILKPKLEEIAARQRR